MRHHTKDKGDMGVGFVIADALKSGFQVATVLSEHLPFDLIIISPQMKLRRLSVKYSTATDGKVVAKYVSSWNDRKGTHIKKADQTEFDATAVYCPDTGEIYYIRNNEIDISRAMVLRLTPPKNGQIKGVNLAKGFLGIHRLFD